MIFTIALGVALGIALGFVLIRWFKVVLGLTLCLCVPAILTLLIAGNVGNLQSLWWVWLLLTLGAFWLWGLIATRKEYAALKASGEVDRLLAAHKARKAAFWAGLRGLWAGIVSRFSAHKDEGDGSA